MNPVLWLLLTPLASMVVAAPLAARFARAVLFLGSLASTAIAVGLTLKSPEGREVYLYPWIGTHGATFSLVLDPLSLPFVLIVKGAALAALRVGWADTRHPKPFFQHCLALDVAATGLFLAGDGLLLVSLWMLSAVILASGPAMGGESSVREVPKFFSLQMASSILLVLGFLLGMHGGFGSLNYHSTSLSLWSQALTEGPAGPAAAAFIWLALALRIGIFPFHGPLMGFMDHAPPPSRILAAAVLTPSAAYLALRLVPSELSVPSFRAGWGIWLGAAGVCTALLALTQTRLARYFAAVLSSAGAWSLLGLLPRGDTRAGGAMLALHTAVLFVGLFVWEAFARRRRNTETLRDLEGFSRTTPRLAGLLVGMLMAALPFPGLSGFPAFVLILKGAALGDSTAYLVPLGAVLLAVSVARVGSRVFTPGLPPGVRDGRELSFGEGWVLIPVLLFLLLAGLVPELLARFFDAFLGAAPPPEVAL